MDNTHLSIDNAEARGFIHRDYIAHCLRWSHVIKHLAKGSLYKAAHVLDIGCGKEMPLAKTMYSSRYIPVTGSYTGVDINRLEVPAMFSTGKFPLELIGGTDFCEHEFPRQYHVVTCFEVLEHVEPEHALRMLKKMATLTTHKGTIFISTPNYDHTVGAAANHVNEMTYYALGSMIQEAGLGIRACYGTFASQKDITAAIYSRGSAVIDLYEELREYYDSNYLATVFAPLYPSRSRNCLWELTAHAEEEGLPSWGFEPLADLRSPNHSSSSQWTAFIERNHDE
jgi:2-polyprenyl-3-methyl-5-hydroxy-6-metoxy-1,4-benzoquinol methylase